MMRATLAVVMLALVATACAAQRVSITVADMPLPEVVKLLKGMTGTQIIGAEAAGPNTPHITLELEDVPLKQVMREVCEQAGWHYTRFGRGYHLVPGPDDDLRPRQRVGDYDVILDRVTLLHSYCLDLRKPDGPPAVTHQLSFNLIAEADDDDLLVAIYAFSPDVLALTDTGVQLEPAQKQLWGRSYGGNESEHRAYISVASPPDGANRIASLEGDLVVYSRLERLEFEFTPADVGAERKQGDVTVKLTAFDPKAGVVQSELTFPQARDGVDPQQIDWVQPRVTVELVDAAGVQAQSSGSNTNGGADNGRQWQRQQFNFQLGPGFAPAKIVYRALVPRGPIDRLTYIFEDVPLPTEGDGAAPIGELP